MDMQSAIQAVVAKRDLSRGEMTNVMNSIMTGASTAAQMGGFLVGLRMKGETIEEIEAAAQVMRGLSKRVEIGGDHVVDIVGTGGDSLSTFNISTASCFIVAAAGGKVAKHGNRSVSSRSGSADLLELAGVNLDVSAERVAHCVEKIGVGFMFAPLHHSAMKYAIAPRREMAVRTIFNLLGPLTNPAGATNLLLGVYAKEWLEPLAKVLKNLGSRHVMVVHAEDGMDEISIGSPTYVAELNNGQIKQYTIQPEDFGMQSTDIKQLEVESPQQSLELINKIFSGESGPARDITLLNAGAALYVAGLADSHQAGIDMAAVAIDSGAARQKLMELIDLTKKPR